MKALSTRSLVLPQIQLPIVFNDLMITRGKIILTKLRYYSRLQLKFNEINGIFKIEFKFNVLLQNQIMKDGEGET